MRRSDGLNRICFRFCPNAPNGPRVAAVMSFSQEISECAEADMKCMTQRLIDAVHDIGGSYYLPYRPHASSTQFLRGYPRAQ